MFSLPKAVNMLTPDRQVLNVLHLGISFLIIFSSELTVANMLKTINTSISQDRPEYNIDGYVALGIEYLVLAICVWLTPSIVAVVGAKTTMIIGSICITLSTIGLILEIMYVSYISAFLVGVGASCLFIGEGNYLVLTSDPENMRRNIGLFWSIYSGATIFGNLFAIFELEGKARLDYDTRHELLYVLTAVGAVGCILLALLGPPKRHSTEQPTEHEGPLQALSKTWKLFRTKEMLILLLTFFFGGFLQSFGSGVYAPSVGFTQEFGNRAKQLVPLSGLFLGIGESIGGLSNMLILKMRKISKGSIIITGFIMEVIAFSLIYINIPNEAVFGETSNSAIIKPKIWIALLCSFLIGVGDSCLNTQIYALIAALHPNHSANTCALFKFSKNISAAAFFFCSNSLGLHLQLIILLLMGVAGTSAFEWVDYKESVNNTNKSCNDSTVE